MKRNVIAYVEPPHWLGHGDTQQELYVKELLAMGQRVLVLTIFPQNTERWAAGLSAEKGSRLFIYELKPEEDFVGRKAAKMACWPWTAGQIRLAEKASSWKVDVVLLAWFDGMTGLWQKLLAPPGLFFTYPWAGLYFIPSHLREDVPMSRRRRSRRRLLDYLAIHGGRCRGIGVLDEGVKAGLEKIGADTEVLPEVTEKDVVLSKEAEKISKLAGGRCIFALVGHLSPRKNLLMFLRMAKEFDENKAFFVLAGKLDLSAFRSEEQEEIKKLLAPSGRGNYYYKLEEVEDPAEFNGFLVCADVVFLVYRNFYHSSGLLAKAAFFGKPVLAAKGYCIGGRVERYGLGLTVESDNYEEILAAAKKMADEDFRRQLVQYACFKEYDRQNSHEALREALVRLLGLA